MSVRHVFVYGTLQPGEERWAILAPLVHGEGRRAAVRGRLYDTGAGYPAALFPADADGVVVGQLFELRADSREEALAVLDEVEEAVEGLYRRITVTASLFPGDDGTPAWAYEFGTGPALSPIASGDWHRRRPAVEPHAG